MSGKYVRTQGLDFMGNKYKTNTCPKCKTKYETIAFDTGPKICPPCDNITLEEHLENGMDYSKSFNECFRDQAKLVREWNDKGKHTETH